MDSTAEDEMNEMDADAKVAIADPATLASETPNLTGVTGGGVYIETGDMNEEAPEYFIVPDMAWIGTRPGMW